MMRGSVDKRDQKEENQPKSLKTSSSVRCHEDNLTSLFYFSTASEKWERENLILTSDLLFLSYNVYQYGTIANSE